MPHPEDRDIKFWFHLVRRIVRMIDKDYTGVPDAASLAEYGISAEEHAVMVAFVEQEAADDYDGPGDTYYADTGESPSYRAAMIDAGRGHLLR